METSKLEAVYFQPGFWGNLRRHLEGWAEGAPASPRPQLQASDVSLQALPPYRRGQTGRERPAGRLHPCTCPERPAARAQPA